MVSGRVALKVLSMVDMKVELRVVWMACNGWVGKLAEVKVVLMAFLQVATKDELQAVW